MEVSLKVLRVGADGHGELCSHFRQNFDATATAIWPDGEEFATDLRWKWLKPSACKAAPGLGWGVNAAVGRHRTSGPQYLGIGCGHTE